MKIIATASGNDRPLPAAGMQQGVIYSVIYLGTQKVKYGDTPEKRQKKLNIAWELPNLPKIEYEHEGQKIMRPSCVFKTYTLSLFKKANLAMDLAGWRGQAFTEAEEKGFDVFKMLRPGVNALLQIVHYESKNGTRATYNSISKLMQGMPELSPENPIVEYEVGMRDNFPDGMPEWAQQVATESIEYKGISREGVPLTTGTDGLDPSVPTDDNIPDTSGYPVDAGDKDDIPF